ncbi:MAG TPA: DUF2804 domain-containing protein [Microthrixaceae bacterium]|nr:DUF2804 domain-containing protein [Microthrixaceae bacterium]
MRDDPGACTERELTEPVSLCRHDGSLEPAAVGWARRPLIDCTLPGSWGRRKRWDFWSVTGPGIAMNVTYADVDYLGLADVWFRDLDAGAQCSASVPRPLARGFRLAPRAGVGSVAMSSRRLELRLEDTGDGTRLEVTFPTRAGDFHAEVVVARPDGHESLTVVIPWTERRFQCTTKDVARPARGSITWGDRTYGLAGDGDAWGCLDFGRGKWPYRTRWNWGAAAGMVRTTDGGAHRVGLQLGGKWTDGTGMTENALVVDGRLSKLSEELVWYYDRTNWLAPWTIRTPRSDRVALTFTPVHDKVGRLHAGVASSSVDQCFGTYAGTVVPDDGGEIAVEGLFGWAEEATWRW